MKKMKFVGRAGVIPEIDLAMLNIAAFSVDVASRKLFYLVQEGPKELARYSISLEKALELGVINLEPLEEIHVERKK